MKRLLILVLMLILALNVATLAAKQPVDSLYVKLHKKAVSNLKHMPSYAKHDYQKLLKKHPDRVMAFLLAYEEAGRLTQAYPQWVENHWKSVTDLMQERNITQPDEFFLSYVAKCTVSDEAITNYRQQFESSGYLSYISKNLDLKAIRQTTSDPAELYRIAMLKTNETLRYIPTSGRDQSPMDVAARSLHGRCEEWQILFIAVCRTLGLPARPASTPWWGHQDDNHAWSEIFIDGKWVYDGGYWPEQNWFTGLTDKMVIIVADGTLPAKDDEVLMQDAYGATVNSTIHYAKENARKVKILVVDKDGKPIAKCPLGINVYNSGSLRPQVFTYTDELGSKTITVGRGAFFLTAMKDSLVAMQFVPSNQEKELSYTLTLNRTDLPEVSVNMEYPSKRVTFKEDPAEWQTANKAANDAWQKKVDDLGLITRPEFFAKMSMLPHKQFNAYADSLLGRNSGDYFNDASTLNEFEVLSLLYRLYPDMVNPADSLFWKVLKRSRFNYFYWLGFDEMQASQNATQEIKAYADTHNHQFPPLESLNPEWLKVLMENDEKDLWQADDRLLQKMNHWFNYIYPKVSYLPRQELLNLLDPTVFYENLPWQAYFHFDGLRKPLRETTYWSDWLYPPQMVLKNPLKPTPQQVYKTFKKKHRVKPEKAIIGLLPLDVALFEKNLTGYNYKILACYYMRANQIPANYTRIPNVIAVYADTTWKYFDLSKGDYYEIGVSDSKKTPVKEEATRMVTFSCYDELKQPLHLNPEQIQICFVKDGQFFPTNEQPDYLENGEFEVELPGEGMFYAQIGYRNSDSLTVYFLRPLTVNKQPVDDFSLECRNYKRSWQKAEDYLLPIIENLDIQNYSYAILGNYTMENTIRMAANLKAAGKKFQVIGYQVGSPHGFDYAFLMTSEELLKKIPSLQSRTITLIKDEKSGDWQMYEGLWDKLP